MKKTVVSKEPKKQWENTEWFLKLTPSNIEPNSVSSKVREVRVFEKIPIKRCYYTIVRECLNAPTQLLIQKVFSLFNFKEQNFKKNKNLKLEILNYDLNLLHKTLENVCNENKL